MVIAYLIRKRLLESAFVRAIRRFTRPLICVMCAQFFMAYSYFIVSAVLVQYLSSNLGLDDVQASLLYSAFGIMISVTGMVFGLMVDQLSVFASIILGACVAFVARILFLFVVPLMGRNDPSWDIAWSTVILVTLLPFGETAMGQAVGIGIKRYVTLDEDAQVSAKMGKSAARSIEYGLSYVLQNVAALLAYASISVARYAQGSGVSEILINRIAIGLSLPALLLSVCMGVLGLVWDTHDIDTAVARREDALLAEDSIRAEALHSGELTGYWRCWERIRPRWMSRLFVSGDTGALFVRYLVVSLALTGAKSLFRHQEATMPKYTQRAFSPTYDYALLLLINPAMVIMLTTFVQSWLTQFEALAVITSGALVCALGAFMYIIPTIAGSYVAVVVFTLGEIIWSPRFTDYVYHLAPEGQEGAFGAVATMPLFLAKIPVGLMSGYLLETYCPAYGNCNGVALWGCIAAFSCTSPIILLGIYRWVTTYKPGTRPDVRLIVGMDYDIDGSFMGESSSLYHLSLGSSSNTSIMQDDNNTIGTPRIRRISTPRMYRPLASHGSRNGNNA